ALQRALDVGDGQPAQQGRTGAGIHAATNVSGTDRALLRGAPAAAPRELPPPPRGKGAGAGSAAGLARPPCTKPDIVTRWRERSFAPSCLLRPLTPTASLHGCASATCSSRHSVMIGTSRLVRFIITPRCVVPGRIASPASGKPAISPLTPPPSMRNNSTAFSGVTTSASPKTS